MFYENRLNATNPELFEGRYYSNHRLRAELFFLKRNEAYLCSDWQSDIAFIYYFYCPENNVEAQH